jgi:uncharacterized protein YoxC
MFAQPPSDEAYQLLKELDAKVDRLYQTLGEDMNEIQGLFNEVDDLAGSVNALQEQIANLVMKSRDK